MPPDLKGIAARYATVIARQKSRSLAAPKVEDTPTSSADLQKPPPNRTNPHDARAPLDSWVLPKQPKAKPAVQKPATQTPVPAQKEVQKAQEVKVQEKEVTYTPPPRPPNPEDKVRSKLLAASVSPEELDIVQAYIREHGLSQSAWLRSIVFAAMKRKVPERGNLRRKKT